MRKIKWFVLFVFVFAFLGYYREFFFVQINAILYMLYYQRPSIVPISNSMLIFTHFSYDTLYYSKYLFTVLGFLFFLAANYFTLKKLTNTPSLVKILFYAYALILLLAGLSVLYGYFINERQNAEEYTLSRWLMGIAQSPIICLILVASEKLYNQSFRHD